MIDRFIAKNPQIAKRQVEIKINEIAVKEKRSEDTKQVWHVKDEYLHYLERDNGESTHSADSSVPISSAPTVSVTKSASIKRKRSETEKSEEKASSSASTITPTTSTTPHAEGSTAGATASGGGGGGGAAPKKPKRAFQIFVKDARAEAEAIVGGADVRAFFKLIFLRYNYNNSNKKSIRKN